MNKRVIMLCSDCFSTVTLYNYISRYYVIEKVITEDPMRGVTLAKKRLKKLGLMQVLGQVMFSAAVVPLLRVFSKKRIDQIVRQYGLDENPIPRGKITHFPSVNDENCIAILKELAPDIVLVNGTRILSRKVLEAGNAVFINMHTGITPEYRGVHGGYWAVVNEDYENCGVTVHLVDKGIDTGSILYQEKIVVTKDDNFVTYPYLQFGEGIPLIKKAMDDVENHKLAPVNKQAVNSRLWYHPAIWQYLYFRIFKNKK